MGTARREKGEEGGTSAGQGRGAETTTTEIHNNKRAHIYGSQKIGFKFKHDSADIEVGYIMDYPLDCQAVLRIRTDLDRIRIRIRPLRTDRIRIHLSKMYLVVPKV